MGEVVKDFEAASRSLDALFLANAKPLFVAVSYFALSWKGERLGAATEETSTLPEPLSWPFFFFLEQMSSSFDDAISSKEIQIVYGIEGYLSL